MKYELKAAQTLKLDNKQKKIKEFLIAQGTIHVQAEDEYFNHRAQPINTTKADTRGGADVSQLGTKIKDKSDSLSDNYLEEDSHE